MPILLSKHGTRLTKLNRRKAIHERCLNCSGWINKEVSNCTHERCKLHPFRTGKGKQNATARNRAIKGYCLDCMNDQTGEVGKCTVKTCSLFIYRKGALDKASISSSSEEETYIQELSSHSRITHHRLPRNRIERVKSFSESIS